MTNQEQVLNDISIYQRQAEICSAFSHPIRLQIVDLLQANKMNCTEIIQVLNIPKPNLSQHLNVLKRAGLVGSTKKGLFQEYYLLNPEIKSACSQLKQALILENK